MMASHGHIGVGATVEVEWLDSVHDAGWEHREDTDTHELADSMFQRSIGYVLEDTPQHIILTQSASRNFKVTDARLIIPKKALVELRLLRAAWPEPPKKECPRHIAWEHDWDPEWRASC